MKKLSIIIFLLTQPAFAELWPIDQIPAKQVISLQDYPSIFDGIPKCNVVDYNLDGCDDLLLADNEVDSGNSMLIFHSFSEDYKLEETGRFITRPGFFGDAWAGDLENDGIGDVLIPFNDWQNLYLLHFKNKKLVNEYWLFNRPESFDQTRRWYGNLTILNNDLDIDKDGYKDLLIICRAGYGLKPRGLMVFSLFKREVLWYYPTGGNINPNLQIFSDETNTKLIFSTNGEENGSATYNYDDSTSSLICLNINGELMWHINVAEGHSTPVLFKCDKNGVEYYRKKIYFK